MLLSHLPLLCLRPGLHLSLLDQHPLLQLIHVLLLLQAHLVDQPPMILPQLVIVGHQLLIRCLRLNQGVLHRGHGLHFGLQDVPGFPQLPREILFDGLIVALLEFEGDVDEGLVLVLLDEGEHAFVGDAELQAAQKTLAPVLRGLLLLLGGGGHARFEVLDDVAGEHLEIKEEVLLTTKDVEVGFGAVECIEEVGIHLWVCYLDGEDLLAGLVGMKSQLHVKSLSKIFSIWALNAYNQRRFKEDLVELEPSVASGSMRVLLLLMLSSQAHYLRSELLLKPEMMRGRPERCLRNRIFSSLALIRRRENMPPLRCKLGEACTPRGLHAVV